MMWNVARSFGADESAKDFVSVQRSMERVLTSLTGIGARGIDVVRLWPDVVGPEIARHSSAVKFSRSCLFVVVGDPRWASELRHLGRQLVDRLNEAVGSNVVVDLKISVRGQPENRQDNMRSTG